MMHIQTHAIDPSKMICEEHIIKDRLDSNQLKYYEEQTRSFMNGFTKTDYGFARMNNVVFYLGFNMCMIIGVSEITKDNVDEVYFRINLMERLGNKIFIGKHVGINDIKSLVGLKVNGSDLTRAKFIQNCTKSNPLAKEYSLYPHLYKKGEYNPRKVGGIVRSYMATRKQEAHFNLPNRPEVKEVA